MDSTTTATSVPVSSTSINNTVAVTPPASQHYNVATAGQQQQYNRTTQCRQQQYSTTTGQDEQYDTAITQDQQQQYDRLVTAQNEHQSDGTRTQQYDRTITVAQTEQLQHETRHTQHHQQYERTATSEEQQQHPNDSHTSSTTVKVKSSNKTLPVDLKHCYINGVRSDQYISVVSAAYSENDQKNTERSLVKIQDTETCFVEAHNTETCFVETQDPETCFVEAHDTETCFVEAQGGTETCFVKAQDMETRFAKTPKGSSLSKCILEKVDDSSLDSNHTSGHSKLFDSALLSEQNRQMFDAGKMDKNADPPEVVLKLIELDMVRLISNHEDLSNNKQGYKRKSLYYTNNNVPISNSTSTLDAMGISNRFNKMNSTMNTESDIPFNMTTVSHDSSTNLIIQTNSNNTSRIAIPKTTIISNCNNRLNTNSNSNNYIRNLNTNLSLNNNSIRTVSNRTTITQNNNNNNIVLNANTNPDLNNRTTNSSNVGSGNNFIPSVALKIFDDVSARTSSGNVTDRLLAAEPGEIFPADVSMVGLHMEWTCAYCGVVLSGTECEAEAHLTDCSENSMAQPFQQTNTSFPVQCKTAVVHNKMETSSIPVQFQISASQKVPSSFPVQFQQTVVTNKPDNYSNKYELVAAQPIYPDEDRVDNSPDVNEPILVCEINRNVHSVTYSELDRRTESENITSRNLYSGKSVEKYWRCSICDAEVDSLSNHLLEHSKHDLIDAMVKTATPLYRPTSEKKIIKVNKTIPNIKLRKLRSNDVLQNDEPLVNLHSADQTPTSELETTDLKQQILLAKPSSGSAIENDDKINMICNKKIPSNCKNASSIEQQQSISTAPRATDTVMRRNEKINTSKKSMVAIDSKRPMQKLSGRRQWSSRDPHPCPVCGKMLSSRGNAAKHITIHSSRKPWNCTPCNLGFNSQRDLVHHQQQNHSSERSHVCPVCTKSFAVSANLKEHMQFHGQRSKSCDICGKFFWTQKCVTRHRKRHFADKKHQCSLCAKAFAVKWDYTLHSRKVHGIT